MNYKFTELQDLLDKSKRTIFNYINQGKIKKTDDNLYQIIDNQLIKDAKTQEELDKDIELELQKYKKCDEFGCNRFYVKVSNLLSDFPINFFKRYGNKRKSEFDLDKAFSFEIANTYFVHNPSARGDEEINNAYCDKYRTDIQEKLQIQKELKTLTEEYYRANYNVYLNYGYKIKDKANRDISKFNNALNLLFQNQSEKDKKLFKYWLVNGIRRIKGLAIKYPTFLGLWGKMGTGKDTFLSIIQECLECETTSYSMQDVISSTFSTKSFYQAGLVRFEEIDARKNNDIAQIKRLITQNKVHINEKYKKEIDIETRNFYCGTSNDDFSCLCNENENRRIISIEWKGLLGQLSLDEIKLLVDDMVNNCPYDIEKEEWWVAEDILIKDVRTQENMANYTLENLEVMENTKDRDGVLLIDRLKEKDRLRKINPAFIKVILNISFPSAKKFLSNERYFEKIEGKSKYYRALWENINNDLANNGSDKVNYACELEVKDE